MRTFRFPFLLILAASATLWLACGDDGTSPDPGPVPDDRVLHEVRDVDYVQNTFFFFDHETDFIGPVSATVKVYRTVLPEDLVADPTIVRVPGWAVPDPIGCGEDLRIAANALSNGLVPNGVDHEFKLLEVDIDYTFVRNAANTVIGLELTTPIPDTELRCLAVSYVNVDGWIVGGTYQQMSVAPAASGYPDKLLLEMLRAPDPDPLGSFASTWALEMRGVYDTGFENIAQTSFEVEIVDLLPGGPHSMPDGSDVPYLRIFGLDQNLDGKIDLTGVDLDRGLIYFPMAQPFHPHAFWVGEWTDGAFSFTGPYTAQYDVSAAIYNEELTPVRMDEVHQYMIRVLAKENPSN